MACIAPDGTLTTQARAVLAALDHPHTPEEVAADTGLPLYRIRSSLRELVDAGLLEPEGGAYRATATGRARIVASPS